MNLVETTTDGVYTLFLEHDTPETRAGLVFRVGQADESLAVRGLTHLVQHLALHEVSGGRVHDHGPGPARSQCRPCRAGDLPWRKRQPSRHVRRAGDRDRRRRAGREGGHR